MAKGKTEEEEMIEVPGFGWRISLSIFVGTLWLVFLILWLFFYAEAYTVYQNLAIVIVSILVIGAILGAAWAPWGMKYGKRMERIERKHKKSGKR